MSIKGLLKDFFYFLLNKLLPFKANQAVILMYHSIGSQSEFFQVTTQDFARQMAYLANNNFKVIGLSKLLIDLSAGVSLPKKTVVITFDDGYLDNYSEAYQVLKRYQFSATIFVNTAEFGKNRQARGGAILPLLSAKEILELHQSGLISFGSHAHHHSKLVHLPPEKINEELSESKKILVDLLGHEVVALAYPSGRYDKTVQQIAGQYYQLGLTVEPGLVQLSDHLLALKRNAVDSAVSLIQFKGLLKFGKI